MIERQIEGVYIGAKGERKEERSGDDMTSLLELPPRRTEDEPNDGPDRTHDGEGDTDDDSEPVMRRS